MLVQLTLDDAKLLKPGDIVYQTDAHNADGTPRRWKVTGQVKTWKRDPTRIVVPLKHGLRTYDHINESDFNPDGTLRLGNLAVEKPD